ncbi:MAG: membrane protein [Cyclobacteriaceae bacterium]|nr:MAG: membrane protein [Cyclobacteriaceae bacterium]
MSLQYAFELAGTFFFAISGALAMRDKNPDWFGAAFTGFITAIGGGTLRDMMLGSYPLVWIGDIRFLYAVLVGVFTAILFQHRLSAWRKTFLLFDTLGIAFFTILGTEKALVLGVKPEIAAIMGMFTAVMGGVIRDTLANELPVLLRREIYATACLAGAALYLLLALHTETPRNLILALSIALVIAIRLAAVKYGLSWPAIGTKA